MLLKAGTIALKPDRPEMSTLPDRFQNDLEQHLQHVGLDLSRPVLVVTDKTRWCEYPDYLPIVEPPGLALQVSRLVNTGAENSIKYLLYTCNSR